MGIEDAFLHDILARPDDDAPRLIYADWLDERNNPRGEFIRVQCALAQLSEEDPRRWPLEQREGELLREHEAKWLPKNIGDASCLFRRGFVEEIRLFLQDFLDRAKSIFAQMPLRHICLREAFSAAEIERSSQRTRLRHVLQSPYVSCLRGLSLDISMLAEDWRSFLGALPLRNLTALKLPAKALSSPLIRELLGRRIGGICAACISQGRT